MDYLRENFVDKFLDQSALNHWLYSDIDIDKRIKLQRFLRLGHVAQMTEVAPAKKSFEYESDDGSGRRKYQNADGEKT